MKVGLIADEIRMSEFTECVCGKDVYWFMLIFD